MTASPSVHLKQVQQLKRRRFHPLLHHIHKKHKISRKTLFYIKEYGPHSNVPKTIIRESLKVLLFASLLSSVGGFAIESVRQLFLSVLPLLLMLPALNSLIGDFGIVLSSHFSTLLHEGRLRKGWKTNKELHTLFLQLIIVSLITTAASTLLAVVLAAAAGFPATVPIALKILSITLLDILLLAAVLFLFTVTAGLYFYHKKEDPNNFLIPLTTSVADFGNMLLLTALLLFFF